MNTKLMLATLCAFGIPAVAAGEFHAGVAGGAYRVDSGEFSDTAPSFELYGGYDFNRFVSVEAAYLRMFDAEDVIGGGDVDFYGNVWELSTTLSYPFAQRLQGFARLGWSYYEATTEAVSFAGSFKETAYGDDFSWGIGGNYDITDRLGLRGEYGQIMVDDGDAEFLSVGLTYGFGKNGKR